MQTSIPEQIAELTRTLIELRSQRVVLDRQLRNAGLDAPARADLVAQRAQLDVRMAEANARLKAIQAEAATQGGAAPAPTGVINVPPVPPLPPTSSGPQWDPDMIVALGGAVIVFVLFPLTVALARRLWRGSPPPAPIPPAINEIPSRLDRLEQAVDAIAIEVERISEGQRFVTKLMSERAAAGESQAHLLGAGPIEPVRPTDRASEKERINK